MADPPKRILIVDDDVSLRQVVAETLRGEGYLVDEASNGSGGLESLRRARPDLALVDMVMPVMDGRGFIEACRAEPDCAELPIVIVSATYTLSEEPDGLNVRAVIPKPFDMGLVLSVVQRLTAAIPDERTSSGDNPRADRGGASIEGIRRAG